MARRKDRILVIDADPAVLDMLEKETLRPAGFDVRTATDGPTALTHFGAAAPDVVMVSLKLADFSGKDMLAALQTQGFDGPTIAVIERGAEADLLPALRLGASDYLTKPLRETEVIAALDRAMQTVQARRERRRLQQRLRDANRELEHRVRELTTLFGIGKAVTNLTDVEALFGKLVEAALYVTGGEMGWLLLADEHSGELILRAARNLPRAITKFLRSPWDGGLAPLVLLSGEPLNVSGEGLAQFPISKLARAAVVVPVQIGDKAVGALVAANKAAAPFTERDQSMLQAVADYASIAVVNVRLFKAVESRAHSLQQAYNKLSASTHTKIDFTRKISRELSTPIAQAQRQLHSALAGEYGEPPPELRAALRDADSQLTQAAAILSNLVAADGGGQNINPESVLLSEIARESMATHQAQAQARGVALIAGFPDRQLHVAADQAALRSVFDNLISSAITFSGAAGGEVYVRILDAGNGGVSVQVQDTGAGLSADQVERLFDPSVQHAGEPTRHDGATGLGLRSAKEIVEAHGGKIWAESRLGVGTSVYFTLPEAQSQ